MNYGQSAFEGLKAQTSAKGRVVLFRPEENAARLQAGASRCPQTCQDVLVCWSIHQGRSILPCYSADCRSFSSEECGCMCVSCRVLTALLPHVQAQRGCSCPRCPRRPLRLPACLLWQAAENTSPPWARDHSTSGPCFLALAPFSGSVLRPRTPSPCLGLLWGLTSRSASLLTRLCSVHQEGMRFRLRSCASSGCTSVRMLVRDTFD